MGTIVGAILYPSHACRIPWHVLWNLLCSSQIPIPMFSLWLCVLGTLSLWLSVFWPLIVDLNGSRFFMVDNWTASLME